MAVVPNAGGLLNLAAGALIVGVGAFVLQARPRSPLHRAFFAFALIDGLNTVAYGLALMASDAPLRAGFVGVYWVTFIPFVAALAAFGFTYPSPLGGVRRRRLAAYAPLAMGALGVAWLVARPRDFWRLNMARDSVYFYEPAGRAVIVAFVVVAGALLVKLLLEVLRARLDSQRRQAAAVMAGIVLSCGTYAVTTFAAGLRAPASLLDRGAAFLGAYAALAAFFALFVVVTAHVALHARARGGSDLRLLLGTLLLVGAAGIGAFAGPSALQTGILRAVSLVAYPALLAYAIVRFEVFDIDAKVRRALTLPVLGFLLAAVFITIETLVANLLQDTLESALTSTLVASLVAGLAAAALGAPLLGVARRAIARVVPAPSDQALHERRLEIYRHSLAAALADDTVAPHEHRSLRALRESLGVSDDEHERVAREITAAS